MAMQKVLSLFVSLVVSFAAVAYGYSDEVAVPISISPAGLSGPLPPIIPIAFSPSLPPLPSSPMASPPNLWPPPSTAAPPLALPPLPWMPDLPSPMAMPSSQPAEPPPVPSASSPSVLPPPSMEAPTPALPSLPSLPDAPMAIPPSQPAEPPPVPSASPPSVLPPPSMEAPPPALPSLPSPVAPIATPPSQAASPRPAAPPPFPSVAPAPAPATPAVTGRGIKGAYWPSNLAQNLPPSSIPTAYFTHVFYAFALVDPTSFQILITQPDEQLMLNFTSTLHAARPPSKALLSIGGAAADSKVFANMVSNSDNRAALIQTAIDTARRYGFDGLDLDWESPENPQDMSDLAILYKEWRSAINLESVSSGKPRLLLTSAVYFASNFFLPGYVPRTYPGDAIRNYVDFVNPMCYDYHGAGWEPNITGSHALLYDKASNVSTSYGISKWKEDGIPSKKMVMGMPAYGKSWQLKDPNQHGIGAPAVGPGPDGGTINYAAILGFNSENNATVIFDNTTMSTYSYAGRSWIGYDDTTSVRYKVGFAKAQGLGGYFFWALGFDSNWELARAASTAWDGN